MLYLAAMTVPALALYDFPAKTGLDGWNSFSPFVLEVARALQLAGLSYEHKYASMTKLKQLNPTGQLPVVAFGDDFQAVFQFRGFEFHDVLSSDHAAAGTCSGAGPRVTIVKSPGGFSARYSLM